MDPNTIICCSVTLSNLSSNGTSWDHLYKITLCKPSLCPTYHQKVQVETIYIKLRYVNPIFRKIVILINKVNRVVHPKNFESTKMKELNTRKFQIEESEIETKCFFFNLQQICLLVETRRRPVRVRQLDTEKQNVERTWKNLVPT